MLKIPRKISTNISIILTVLFMLCLITGSFFMPSLVRFFIENGSGYRNTTTSGVAEYALMLSVAYLIILFSAAADVLLFLLLLRVKRGLVFTAESVGCIRMISWFCIFIGVLFAALGYWFLVSFGVGFAALFVGICLRVVKNVIEEATEIKTENDLTI